MQSRILSTLAATAILAFPLLMVDSGGGQGPLDVAPDPLIQQDLPPEGIEPLVRGPVHEAYAQPSDLLPEPGEVVPKAPPQAIPEIPPDMRPEGDNVVWISGYWAWDPEAAEFIWVSGVYRVVPEDRQWVPGHWVHTDEGWRWVSGFWAAADAGEVPYTPEPPETLERGPSLPPPDAESFYVPGTWIYRDSRFVWRPGYYSPARPGLIWIHARYIWCPTGYIFVDGYMDHPLEDRGVLFSPVVFHRPFWNDPSWSYCPGYVVRPNFFLDAFFYNRGHNHFYFGNYYASRGGFHPWWGGPARFDPHFQYYRWRNRNDANWAADLRLAYSDRAAGRRSAPPTTFKQQQNLLARGDKADRNLSQVLSPLGTAGRDLKLTRLGPAQLEKQKAFGLQARELSSFRAKTERSGLAMPKAGKEEFRTLKLPASEARLKPPVFDRALPGKLLQDQKGVLTFPPPRADKGEPPGFPAKDGIGKFPRDTSAGPPRQTFDGKGGLPKKSFGTPGITSDPPRGLNPGKFEGPKVTDPGPRIVSDPPKGVSPGPVVSPPKKSFGSPKGLSDQRGPGRDFTPAPRVDAPRITTPAPTIVSPPKGFSPPATPKIIQAPKAITSTPRAITSPPPTPRITAPEFTTPSPRFQAPKAISSPPRAITSPPPTPRITTPAPRLQAPRAISSQPRSTAPRISTPSAPRLSAPSRPGGGGGRGGGGGGGFKGGGGGRGKGR